MPELSWNYSSFKLTNSTIHTLTLIGSNMTALYEMYSDESENGNFITVAGFIFTKKHTRRLELDWCTILKKNNLPYFHMVDCAHGNDTFESMRHDKERRIEIQTELFTILKKYKSVGFTVSFDKRLSHLLPSSLNLEIEQITPYTLCSYWLMLNASKWAKQKSPDAEISYFYEAGHKSESQAVKIMQALYTDTWHRNHFKIASFSFVEKKSSAAIQTGDILAWQWCKYKKDTDNDRHKVRKDLLALIDDKKTYCTDFNEQKILELIEIIRTHKSA